MGRPDFSWVFFVLCWVFLADADGSVLISSPFDNFRLECSQMSGAQRISMRMVESQGQKRQDTVFAISCNKVQELYPWFGIPQGVEDIEREDCHYSLMMDPIMDESVNATCGPREYISGITRMSDTRIQVMCCRLRSRDEKNCNELKFAKPIVNEGRIEIENNAQLINALSIRGNYYVARFCDLAPRSIGLIVEDIPTTTVRPTTKPWMKRKPQKTRVYTTWTPVTRKTSPTTERTTLTSSQPHEPPPSTRSPMRVIKVNQPAFLRNPSKWDLNMKQHLKSQLPEDQVRLERPLWTEIQGLEATTISQNDIDSLSQNVHPQHGNSVLTEFEDRVDPRRHPKVHMASHSHETARNRRPQRPRSSQKSRERQISSYEPRKHHSNRLEPHPNSLESTFHKQRPKLLSSKTHKTDAKFEKIPLDGREIIEEPEAVAAEAREEYDYDEKTSRELMKSIIDFMEAQKKAKNIIEKVRSSKESSPNKMQYQMAKQLLKEFESISPEIGSLVKSTELESQQPYTNPTDAHTSNTPAIDFKSIEQVTIPRMPQPSNNPTWSQLASIQTHPVTNTQIEASTLPSNETFDSMDDLMSELMEPAKAPQKHGHMSKSHKHHIGYGTHSNGMNLGSKSTSREHIKPKHATKDKSKRLYLFVSSTIPPQTTDSDVPETSMATEITPSTVKPTPKVEISSTPSSENVSEEEWYKQMSEVITKSGSDVPKTVPETTTATPESVTLERKLPKLVSESIEEEDMEYDEGKHGTETEVEPEAVLDMLEKSDDEKTTTKMPEADQMHGEEPKKNDDGEEWEISTSNVPIKETSSTVGSKTEPKTEPITESPPTKEQDKDEIDMPLIVFTHQQTTTQKPVSKVEPQESKTDPTEPPKPHDTNQDDEATEPDEYEDITGPGVTASEPITQEPVESGLDSTLESTTAHVETTSDGFYATMNSTPTWSTAGEVYKETSESTTPVWDETNVVTFKPMEEREILENLNKNDVDIRKAPQKLKPVDEFVSLAPFDAFPSPPSKNGPFFPQSIELLRKPPKLHLKPAQTMTPIATTPSYPPQAPHMQPVQLQANIQSQNLAMNSQRVMVSTGQQNMLPQQHGVRTWGPQGSQDFGQNGQFGQPQIPQGQSIWGQHFNPNALQPQFWQGQNPPKSIQQFLSQNPQHQSWLLNQFGQQQQGLGQFQQAQFSNPGSWHPQNGQFAGQNQIPVQQSQFQQAPQSIQAQTTTQGPIEVETTTLEATTKRHRAKTTTNPRYPRPDARGKLINQPYVDEETEDSPFEDGMGDEGQKGSASHKTETSGIDRDVLESFSYDVAPQEVEVSEQMPKGPFDMSKEIRRAPIPRHDQASFDLASKFQDIQKFEPESKSLPKPSEPWSMNTIFPNFEEPQQEYEVDMPNLPPSQKDGVKTYDPPGEEPIEGDDQKSGTRGTSDEQPFADELDRMNLPEAHRNSQEAKDLDQKLENDQENGMTSATKTLIKMKKRRPKSHEDKSSEVSTEITTTGASTANETTAEYISRDDVLAQWEMRRFKDLPQPKSTSTEVYDVRTFYHTKRPPRPPPKERYLTFCTKDVAIRDQNDLVVACGSELEVWQPNRCPPGSDCFIAPDSTYRICCPVYTPGLQRPVYKSRFV